MAGITAATAALIGLAAATAGGAAKAGIGALAQKNQNKQAKDMELLHTTSPGFDNFSDDLVDEDENDRFGLNSKVRPVIFPSAVKRSSNKFSL